ncbi:replication protein A 70 kDa DNA-binding subunit C-like isoform X2 [Miscanthus floridulus]|uniref:replication protein A 70 kDa DNA-binding subunit C-like isoform X2 n=1 Tax=Miscanthus floridulus TaxID=154761 RepID=UPI00345A40D1
MEAAAQLTPGAVQAIANGAVPAALQPVLQVLEVCRIATTKSGNSSANPNPIPSERERYRLILSDGINAHQAILATAFNPFVRDGTLRAGTIVHLNEFICDTIQDKRIIIIVKIEILQTACALIGNPKNYMAQSLEKVQDPNLSAIAAQNSGAPGMLESSVALRADQASNNLSYGGPYNDVQGMVGFSIGRTVEPDHSNVFTGGSYGTLSAQNTVNANMVEPRFQQPSLISHQNQGFAVTGTGEALTPPGNAHRRHEHSYQQLPSGYINRASVASEPTSHVVPISSLKVYQTRWTIKARVTAKTVVKHWNNAKGTGKLFSFDLLDGEGGQIRAVCFKEAVDRFYDLIEVDKVYLISRGAVKPSQKRFNPLNNDLEITLDALLSSVEICSSDDFNIPKVQYSFRQISEIENMDNHTVVDLLGVVTSVGPSVMMTRKGGTQTQKRTLQLRDMSGWSVGVTFWGNFCDVEGQQLQLQCDSSFNPILALIGARISDFSGRSVSTIGSTQLKINPDFPDAERLRQWYVTEGMATACLSLSRQQFNSVQADVRKTIAQIKDETLGRGKTDWITVKAAISHVQTENFCYPACPFVFNEKPCNKKVIESGDGMWFCERCDKSSGSCEYRYMVKFQIQDHTSTINATAFQEAGEKIFGRTAQELRTIRNVDHDEALFTEIIEGARWHLNLFKLKVREESYNDEQLIGCTIVSAEKLDPSKESRILFETIDSLMQSRSGPSPGDQGNIASKAGFSNSPGGRSAINMCGANQFGQQGSIDGRVSTTPVGGGFTGNNYGSAAGNARSDVATNGYVAAGNARQGPCFKCNQPGHWSKECPGRL